MSDSRLLQPLIHQRSSTQWPVHIYVSCRFPCIATVGGRVGSIPSCFLKGLRPPKAKAKDFGAFTGNTRTGIGK
eukprot:709058-Pyramimonas_sp.AAC.1